MTTSAAAAPFHAAKIIQRYAASPTVMVLELKAAPTLSAFHPAQWVDFVAPPHEWVGGFSIASCPSALPRLTLAVKRSSHAPSTWVHDESQVDMSVKLRVGGDCILADDDAVITKPAVFLAGGIGISPVLAQYREFHRRRRTAENNMSLSTMPPTSFLYSVSTEEELVFGDELIKIFQNSRSSNSSLHDQLIFTLTQQDSWKNEATVMANDGVDRRIGRQLEPFLQAAPLEADVYVCGPPKLLDASIALLESRNIPLENIKCERWW